MAEQRFERDLRAWLAADLDPVRGPHPRWADAPAARRIAASLLIRASDAGSARDAATGRDGTRLLLEVRVVGRLDRAFDLDRFVILRGGRVDTAASWSGARAWLPISADAPVGTWGSVETVVYFDPYEHVDLAYLGSGSYVTFRYAVHRTPPAPSMRMASGGRRRRARAWRRPAGVAELRVDVDSRRDRDPARLPVSPVRRGRGPGAGAHQPRVPAGRRSGARHVGPAGEVIAERQSARCPAVFVCGDLRL